MTDFYRDVQGIASELLAEFGQGSLEYVAVVPGNGPKDNPGAPQETIHALDAVARGVKFKYIDGTLIVATDMQLTMPGAGVAPNMNGFIRTNGTKRHKIVKIDTKPPTGVPVVHVVIFRG